MIIFYRLEFLMRGEWENYEHGVNANNIIAAYWVGNDNLSSLISSVYNPITLIAALQHVTIERTV